MMTMTKRAREMRNEKDTKVITEHEHVPWIIKFCCQFIGVLDCIIDRVKFRHTTGYCEYSRTRLHNTAISSKADHFLVFNIPSIC